MTMICWSCGRLTPRRPIPVEKSSMRRKARSTDESGGPDKVRWISLIFPSASASLRIRVSAGSMSRRCCRAAALASDTSRAGWAAAEIATRMKAAEINSFCMTMRRYVWPEGFVYRCPARAGGSGFPERWRLARLLAPEPARLPTFPGNPAAGRAPGQPARRQGSGSRRRAALCRLRSDTEPVFETFVALSLIKMATVIEAEVILPARLPLPAHSGGANRQRGSEGQRLLHRRRRPIRGTAAERAVHPIDVCRPRMPANLAKPFLHHLVLSQDTCRKIVAEVGREVTKLCNRWNGGTPAAVAL